MTKSSPLVPARHRASVAVGFLHGMLSTLIARQIDCAPILNQVSIDPAVLHDPNGRFPIDNFCALYNLLAHMFDDEGLGLFSAPLRVGSFEFLCRSVVTSRTLHEVLERSSRFLRVVLPDLLVTVSRDRTTATLRICEARQLQNDYDDPRRIFAFEWILRLVHALSCWMAGRELALNSVAFPYAQPAHAADYKLIYTDQSTFGAKELVATLNGNLLDLPVRRDDEALATFLVQAPGNIAALYRRDRLMVRRVREIVARSFPESIGLDDIARQLHLSSRTVHRRLQEEGSSLRAIKDGLRRDFALFRLEKTTQSIAQISADLGYADTSTFFRAFITWTGASPSTYRQRLAQKQGH